MASDSFLRLYSSEDWQCNAVMLFVEPVDGDLAYRLSPDERLDGIFLSFSFWTASNTTAEAAVSW
jgi:hypothetical protein